MKANLHQLKANLSKLFTDFRFCFCFGFNNIWENILTCTKWIIQEACYKIYLTSCAAKSLWMKCFDAEKLHSRVQASIFRLLGLIKRWNVLDTYIECILYKSILALWAIFYISLFTISLRDNPKYTLQKVILYHYRFLSSKAYQNRCHVIRIGPGVPGSVSWVMDLEVLGPRSRVTGPRSRFLILDYATLSS